MEGEWEWYEHIEKFLFVYYTSYKEYWLIREEIDTVSFYIMKSNVKHNYISIYMSKMFRESMFWYIIISSISGFLIKCHSVFKSALNRSTQALCSTTNNLLYGYKEYLHWRLYEPNSILQRIIWQGKGLHIENRQVLARYWV